VNNIGNEGAIKLSEALKSNSSLSDLNLSGDTCCLISFSLNTENKIGNEGAIQLFEALKSNTSITSLNLNGFKLVALFHSHPVQTIALIKNCCIKLRSISAKTRRCGKRFMSA
jgi:hypothetical protein